MKEIEIKRSLKIIYHLFSEIGFRPLNTINSIKGIPIYLHQLLQFISASSKLDSLPAISTLFPSLVDRYENAGRLDHHYFHQDLWASRKVFEKKPEHHVDVGSRIDGFVSHVLTFRDIEVLDVRKLTSSIKGMSFRQVDLMQTNTVPENICDSLSCLHALEHFGLGRYGDPIDPEGHIKGLQSLKKLLKSGGVLLLSVPIGKERVEFNAHRIFAVETIISLTNPDFKLYSFSYIDDKGIFHENVDYTALPEMVYGCGMFELIKQ
ncbi:MAG: DUF268 domain-containing protein [Richelia sp. RM1_1_1]|nr:DUF268 domain-containing protein [Richelia sp. RM1_1_1]